MKDIILKPGTFYKTIKNSTSDRIPGESLESYVVELLKSPTCCAKYVTLTKKNYTQATSQTTAVTTTTPAGEITMFGTLTTAANGVVTFKVNNSLVTADSVIIAVINDYSAAFGTAGLPQVAVDTIAAGSFDLVLLNTHSSAALNGTIKIAYSIF
jgi:microcompartment protein CcmK/EutM